MNQIPPMDDPLGFYWKQPTRDQIEIDDTHALMTAHAFDRLSEYTTTNPSGVYPGKMWRSLCNGEWWLRWYGVVDGRPDLCSNNQRRILIV